MMTTRTHVLDRNGVVNPIKVHLMLNELRRNGSSCLRVPLPNDTYPTEKKLYINVEYTQAVAYDYPFMGFDVFSIDNDEKETIFDYIKQRHDIWYEQRFDYCAVLMDCDLSVPFDVGYIIYQYATIEPPQIKFNKQLLGNNFGISDSFLCGCIRCVHNKNNPIWSVYNLTNKDLKEHLESEFHSKHANV